ncbi:MAG: hypothetical protein LAT52_10610 [Balneolales bacterium]|nr:hypothetical protein [Balneolales bacterium]
MKRNKFLYTLGLTSALLFGTQTVKAQFSDAGDILRAGASDAEIVFGEYIRPAAEGFAVGLNTGWFNTAGTHSLLGFDLTFRANVAAMPSNLKTFELTSLPLQNSRPIDGSTMASTVIGADNSTTMGIFGTNPITNAEEEIARFDIPGGINFSLIPTAMAQLSVGIIKNTDISIRYMPTVSVGSLGLDAGLYGFGIKHDIKQWIPVVQYVPIDISFAAGFTSFTANSDLDVRPGNTTAINTFPNSHWDDQAIKMTATGTNFNLLVGRGLPIISAYAGIGYEISNTSIKVEGNYPVESINSVGMREIESISNPLDLSFDGSNSVRALAGARLKFFLLTISADVVVSNVTVGSVGVGISFR